jgi:hypothetical protein
MKKHKIGTVPDGRIAVIDGNGNVRGHVGPHSIAGTAMRFGLKNPQLKTVRGKLEWHDGGQSSQHVRRPSADRVHAKGSIR